MNTQLLIKGALVAALSLVVIAPPAEARSRKDDRRHHHSHRYDKKKHHHKKHHHTRLIHRRPLGLIPAPLVVVRPTVAPRTVYAADTEALVQRELARRGYYRGVIDGQVGPQTRASIRAYQVDRGLPVTGRVDGPLLRSLRLA